MKKILIIGLGLIGGSYAQGLTKKGYEISAIDPDQSSITYALNNRLISSGAISVDSEIIQNADIVIFATYPKTMVKWIVDNQHLFAKGTIITDVSGVKCGIVDAVEAVLRDDLYFVGSHPMAGKEVSGVENADCEIFKEANFIITPTKNSNEQAITAVHKIAEDLEFHRISSLSPKEHDEAVGFLSQLSHVIAVSLMNCHDNENFIKYTGDSFRDLTRIAIINEHLWSELFFENRDVLINEIRKFVAEVENLKEKLENNDEEGLKELFIQSTNHRIKYLKQL